MLKLMSRFGCLMGCFAFAAGCGVAVEPVRMDPDTVDAVTSAHTGMSVYPNASTVFNPRIPTVSPVDDGEGGRVMDVAVDFTYQLAPFLGFDEGGSVELRLRDTPRRLEKEVFALSGGALQLRLVFEAASRGREPVLQLKESGNERWSKPIGEPWGDAWQSLSLSWADDELSVSVAGQPFEVLDLPDGFSPERVYLNSQLVDDLKIVGDGSFTLGWDEGYRARILPAAQVDASRARLFGFDAYAVSQDPDTRDFPMIQVSNGSTEVETYRFDFELKGEVAGLSQNWSQTIEVAPRQSLMVPIDFPGGLASDVYHLRVQSAEGIEGYEAVRHFFYAQPRNEPEGPSKFGLHDSNNRRFGSWPDALGIDFAHAYAYWGYVVGPAWVRDYKGGFGIDPETPPEQWAWNERVDWHLGHGLEVYLSLQSEPLQVWMRERKYPEQRIKKFEWGERGGFPKLDLYTDFVRELCQRYRGKIKYFEIENEPNAGGRDQIPPEDYALIAKATYEVIHDVIPEAEVYGICGTGRFEPWMERVFEVGGHTGMDGVSIHTYVTPQMPEQANLSGKLAEVNRIIDSTGREMPIINSETGTYIALREQVDQPISESRLESLIEAGTPSVVVARGWPNYAMSEMRGGASIVQNALYNFAAGAKRFVFFGWNPDWPIVAPGADWMDAGIEKNASGFSLISMSRDGQRTPGWHTLAIGVLVEQLKGAQLEGIHEINRSGVRGVVFPKANGGEVAVLWSTLGKRTVLVEADAWPVEQISLHGQSKTLEPAGGGIFSLEVDSAPVYLHLEKPGMSIASSPILNVRQMNDPDGAIRVAFTLVNREKEPWSGKIAFPQQEGWRFDPPQLEFDLSPRSREDLSVEAIPPQAVGVAESVLEANLSLPGGAAFTVPVNLKRRPLVFIADAPEFETGGARALAEVVMPGGRLALNRPEQVVVGRPPKLTSIQEDQYWQGPAELSAEVKVAANQQGLYIYLNVTDANPELPQPWPGVLGSTVELFFDLRSPGKGFGVGLGDGVHQVLLKPALEAGADVLIHNVDGQPDTFAGAQAKGGPTESGYWLTYFVPWSALGRTYHDQTPIGFDVGINASGDEPGTRKSQIMLFGTASNHKDASGYGVLLPATD